MSAALMGQERPDDSVRRLTQRLGGSGLEGHVQEGHRMRLAVERVMRTSTTDGTPDLLQLALTPCEEMNWRGTAPHLDRLDPGTPLER